MKIRNASNYCCIDITEIKKNYITNYHRITIQAHTSSWEAADAGSLR